MKRSGFTMVELIFVIIIIGILSVAAIPKFGDIRDKAKVNSEFAELSALESPIVAAMEFHNDDFGNIAVLWHEQNSTAIPADYDVINANDQVLRKVIKKGEDLDIVAYIDRNAAGTAADSLMTYDIIFLTGTASNATSGVRQPVERDTPGKPDRNDVWVFNSSAVDINVSGTNVSNTVEVLSGELKLIDADDTLDYTTVDVISSDGSTITTALHPTPL